MRPNAYAFSVLLALPVLGLAPLGAQGLPERNPELWEGPLSPGQPSKPIPSLEEILKRALELKQGVTQLADAYCYREVETEQKLDGKGQPTESEVSVFEVTRLPGGKKARRLVERNGKLLSSKEAEAEEAKIQAFLNTVQEGDADQGAAKGKDASVSLTKEEVLSMLAFDPVTRKDYQGRSTLVLRFHPRPSASPKGTGQRFVGKLQGEILVDEASCQVVRLEGKLLDSLWVGGGLLGSVAPPTSFHFEQQQVAEGLWMPMQASISIHGRITVVPMRRRITSQFRDYRKFVVGDPVVGAAH